MGLRLCVSGSPAPGGLRPARSLCDLRHPRSTWLVLTRGFPSRICAVSGAQVREGFSVRGVSLAFHICIMYHININT